MIWRVSQAVITNTRRTDEDGIQPRCETFNHRYHGVRSSNYPLPNDAEEVIRLDDLHYMYWCYLHKNVVAPIVPNPTLIIDLGTGSGRWPIEVAAQYENCRVVGVDISPAMPSYEIPDNCEFIVADITDELEFDDGSADLVHSRQFLTFNRILMARVLMGGIKKDQWPSYLRDIKRILKPGAGWAQCTEFRGAHLFDDKGNLPKDSALREVFLLYFNADSSSIDIFRNLLIL